MPCAFTSQGLLPAATFRGTATRYTDEHLLRLATIRKLQIDKRLPLAEIRLQLSKLTYAELSQLGKQFLASRNPTPPPTSAAPSAAPVPHAGQLWWQRIQILPGLELHLRSDASPHIRRIVQEIETQFAAVATSAVLGLEREPSDPGTART